MATTVYRPSTSSTGDVDIVGDVDITGAISASGTIGTIGIDSSATATAIIIDASENVGIKVGPETWHSDYDVLQIGLGGSFSAKNATGKSDNVFITANGYFDSSNARWEYIESDVASQLLQAGGLLSLNVAATGTADDAITWVTCVQVDNDATSGNTKLLVYDVDNDTLERVSVGIADSGGAGFKLLRIPN